MDRHLVVARDVLLISAMGSHSQDTEEGMESLRARCYTGNAQIVARSAILNRLSSLQMPVSWLRTLLEQHLNHLENEYAFVARCVGNVDGNRYKLAIYRLQALSFKSGECRSMIGVGAKNIQKICLRKQGNI